MKKSSCKIWGVLAAIIALCAAIAGVVLFLTRRQRCMEYMTQSEPEDGAALEHTASAEEAAATNDAE